ncbi:uncharacterized protein LOC128982893 [Macrosteles quadrilineatus]|uniref:uncharacterized protein LOC128982893 n=1 Tax=Macrosteles quadrilineatus TaxID=74068 RepID=UPI0023E204D3|nr:uncharacterized protein LOC128982893 [Macrosteles quadrilineatus]
MVNMTCSQVKRPFHSTYCHEMWDLTSLTWAILIVVSSALTSYAEYVPFSLIGDVDEPTGFTKKVIFITGLEKRVESDLLPLAEIPKDLSGRQGDDITSYNTLLWNRRREIIMSIKKFRRYNSFLEYVDSFKIFRSSSAMNGLSWLLSKYWQSSVKNLKTHLKQVEQYIVEYARISSKNFVTSVEIEGKHTVYFYIYDHRKVELDVWFKKSETPVVGDKDLIHKEFGKTWLAGGKTKLPIKSKRLIRLFKLALEEANGQENKEEENSNE